MRIDNSSLKKPLKPHKHKMNAYEPRNILDKDSNEIDVELNSDIQELEVELDENENIVEISFRDFLTTGMGMIISDISFNEYGQLIFTMTNGTHFSIDLSTVTENKMNVFEIQTLSDLPIIGSDKTLYLIKQEKELYYWDTLGYCFKRIGFDYEDIDLIDGGNATSIK